MPATVRVNELTLAHRATGGWVRSTLPDVCLSPVVPVPYVNVSYITTLAKGTLTVHADGGNMIAVKGSEQSTSVGDEPGTGGGVISGVNMDRATWLSWSPDVFMEGRNACRLTDKMLLNRGNTVSIGGHWDPKVKGANLKKLCEIACKCEMEHPNAKAPIRDQCFQKELRAQGYKDNRPTPETMQNGNLSEVVYLKDGWQVKESASNPGLPSNNPFSPGSRRPDVTTRANGLTTGLVEMKFGGDEPSDAQNEKYPKIAEALSKRQGNDVKYDLINVDRDCDCKGWQKDRAEKEAKEATEAAEQTAAGAALRYGASRLVGGPVTMFFGTLLESSPAY